MNNTDHLPKIWAIIPAAGIGVRMGKDLPKQYLTLAGQPILAHTLNVICQVPGIHQVIVPLHAQDQYWPQLIDLPYPHLRTITGGDLRFESVLNALNFIKPQALADDWVLVHDAVRPCITALGISELLSKVMQHEVGGLWGVPVRDTLKKVNAQQEVAHTVPREDLWHALTPQIFKFGILHQAITQAQHDKVDITDEASAIEHLGYHPLMVQGSYSNIKMTWPEDLIAAELWFEQQRRQIKCE